jgi:hypothetical protein
VGPSRDVIALTGAVPAAALVLRPGVPMEGWLLLLAFLGAAWIMFRD